MATTVLNVDDHEGARYARTRVLKAAGFEVLEAGTGADALALARSQRPSVILLDINLPDMSGFEVCQRLKADTATAAIPVLHTSASFTEPAARAAGLDGGAEGYLVEPVDTPVLVATINALVRSHRADAERQEFLGLLSHDMRGPLNTILGWTTMLRAGRLDPVRTVSALETIERAARQQAQLVDDLLDLARIASGQLQLDLRPIDLRKIIDVVVVSLEPQMQAAGLTCELADDPAACAIVGDEHRLQQVVWNLLTNAIKFTPRGGKITISVTHEADHARLTVADSGQGIDPAFLPYVFDRYRREDETSKSRRTGLGLGLAIVRHLVELHGGTVSATSAGVGRGAAFTITLPLARAAA